MAFSSSSSLGSSPTYGESGFLSGLFSSTDLVQEPTHDKYSEVSGEFSLWSNQYAGEDVSIEGNKYRVDAEAIYHRNKPGSLERKLHGAFARNDAGANMFSVQEAYVRHTFGKSSLTYGRYVLPWSKIDAYWGFGFVNNRRNFDYFTPGQEGLTGVTFNRKYENNIRLQIFASPLYVPELNPGLDIDNENKTITSRNPWAKPPANSTELNGDSVPIKYTVDYPEIADVVAQVSAGLNVGYESGHFTYDLFYLKKPENTLTQAAEIVYSNPAESVLVNVKPQIYYHNVFGGNIVYNNTSTQMYFSALSSVPDNYPTGDELVTDWTKLETEKIREDYLALGFNRGNDKFKYGVNYIARVSSYDKKEDILAQNPRWSQAVNLHTEYVFTKKLRGMFDIKFDTLSYDRLIMIKGDYQFSRRFKISGGANIIGTKAGADTYWADFINNDSVYTKFSYVF